jgi:hypothetical protein
MGNPRGTPVMHGCRESASPIVSTKLPNNGLGAPGLAEGVERRGLAKGNLVEPPGAGHRAGKPCHRRTTGYGRCFAPARHHPRQEPGAGVPHAGIGAGLRQANMEGSCGMQKPPS